MRFSFKTSYPEAADPKKVGTYSLEAFSGGGYFYDDFLEYRVWVKRGDGLECYSFATYPAAYDFARRHQGAEHPVALVLQREYIDEQKPGEYVHIKRERLAEWRVDWLGAENRGTHLKIPEFLKHIVKSDLSG